ncbi:hypothetical protein BD626DRAFT_516744 [Schizophyllum amplum]|uniref:Uncharacterized protein n=1 Tax=Schizophyllum amplum TaxID=97359 RepID=A0A550BWX4_9AGAR|nr:hypothetical protein BD626DRAFT_516744 [Auriculariopsis ampla]
MLASVVILAASMALTNAHGTIWGPGMYCANEGNPNADYPSKQNSYHTGYPLYQLPWDKFWLNNNRNCKNDPPPDGEFMEVPANGVMKVQFASSRAHTNYGWGGKFYTGFVDGLTGYDVNENQPDCVTSPNIHAQNASMVAGSAFAIAYKSDINSVGLEDMVVFSVNQHAPWITVDYEYEVPDLPACPEGGCICAWSWIPNGCGEANMFLNAYRCKVTGATNTHALAAPQTPSYCEFDDSSCVQGAKQLLVWHQADGIDNINVDNRKQANGEWASPGFNDKCGFKHGAQTDIFSDSQISYTPSDDSSSSSASSSDTSAATGNVAAVMPADSESSSYEEPASTSSWEEPSSTSAWEEPASTSTWEEPASTSTWEEPASSSVWTESSSEASSTWSSSSAASSATAQCRSRASRRSLKRDLARAAAERKAREDPSIPERRAMNAHARSQRRAAHGL